MGSEIFQLFAFLVGWMIGGIVGCILGAIISDRFIHKRTWGRALRFWKF